MPEEIKAADLQKKNAEATQIKESQETLQISPKRPRKTNDIYRIITKITR